MITKDQIQQYQAPSVPFLEEPTLYMPTAPKVRVPVPRVLGAVLGMGFGFLATPVLVGYLPLMWAIVLGTVLAGGLALGFLTRQQVLICLLPAVSPLAFLAGPHSALLLAVIAIAALATLWFALRVSSQRGG